jgi:hypothetical protein
MIDLKRMVHFLSVKQRSKKSTKNNCWTIFIFGLRGIVLVVNSALAGKKTRPGVDFRKVGCGVKSMERTQNLGENAKSWAQGLSAWCQIRVNLNKKDGRKGPISTVGCKLLYEIFETNFKIAIA